MLRYWYYVWWQCCSFVVVVGDVGNSDGAEELLREASWLEQKPNRLFVN